MYKADGKDMFNVLGTRRSDRTCISATARTGGFPIEVDVMTLMMCHAWDCVTGAVARYPDGGSREYRLRGCRRLPIR